MSGATKTQVKNGSQQAGQQVVQRQEPPSASANTETGLSLLDKGQVELARAIDQTAAQYSRALDTAQGHFEKTFLMSKAIVALRRAITDEVMQHILALQGSPNGFKTDKDRDGGYPAIVVKECLITSLLNGFYPVGNEWNIIAGQFYATKNGWIRKLEEVPGISDINCSPGRIVVQDGQTLVRVALSWRLNGIANQLVDHEGKAGQVFTVQTLGKPSPDNILGKATAKAYHAAYRKATGSYRTLEDAPDVLEGKVLETKILPAPTGSRAATVAGQLGENPAVRRAELLGRVKALSTALALAEADWNEIADLLQVPGDPNACDADQLARVLAKLEAEQARAEAVAQEERAAMQGGNA